MFEGRIEKIASDRGLALVKVTHEDVPVIGLLHQPKMTPALRERFYNQELRVGDPLMVEVVDVDPTRRKLSFRDRPFSEIVVPEPVKPVDSFPTKRSGVQFTAYCPLRILPATWNSLLVYCHLREAITEVEQDSRSHLLPPQTEFQKSSVPGTQLVARDTEIAIIPFFPGCRFNPPQQSVALLEGLHRVEFRFQADPGLEGFAIGVSLPGRLLFYVGSELVGDVECKFELRNSTP